MITAYPEITEDNINDIDYIFLGCDGIWDCKTNQEAVDYVSNCLKKNPNVKLSTILESLLDEIVADDIYNGKY